MTPPPSSAATSFCDTAAILPSLYLATARASYCARPSRLALSTHLTPHRRVLPLRLPSHLTPHRRVPPSRLLSCCRCPSAAIVLLSPRPAVFLPGHRILPLSCPIAICCRVAPRPIALHRRAASRPAVAPEVVLQDKQRSGVVLPCLVVALSAAIALPSSCYRPSPAVIPLLHCCHLLGSHPSGPAIKCRRALLPCRCGSALLLLTYLDASTPIPSASTHIPSSPIHLHDF